MLNLEAVLSAMPGAALVPGLASAWRWSPNPMFTFTAALSWKPWPAPAFSEPPRRGH
ncbi:hypothetical protein [Streptomyces sp. EMB24]|uniref:hypothetical protein n=1 Tax=Streptomyces sp. EMB24 TaxID=2835531 RepID=UPI00227AFC06|nr:hypothetical protein [Streptomyces sp. EMB24]